MSLETQRMDFGIHSLMYILFLASGVVMASTPQAANYGNLLTYTLVTFIVLIGVVHLFHERDVYRDLFKSQKGMFSWFYNFIELVRYLVVFLMIVLWLVYSISVYPNQQSNSVDVYACAWSNTTSCISGNTTEWSTNSICGGAYNAKYPILYSVMNAITDFVYAKYTLYTITMVIGLVSAKDLKMVKPGKTATKASKNYIWIVLFWLCFVADVLINCLYNYNVMGSSFTLSTSEEYSYVSLIANAFLAFMFAHTALDYFIRKGTTRTDPFPIVSYVSHNAAYVIVAFLAMELYTQSLLFSDSLRILGFFIVTMFVPLSMAKITLRTPLNPTVLDYTIVKENTPVIDFFRVYATCNAIYYLFFTVLYSIWKGSYVSNQFLPLNTNAWAFSPSLWCGPYSWNIQDAYAWIYTLVVTAITAVGLSFFMSLALFGSYKQDEKTQNMFNHYKTMLTEEISKISSASEEMKNEKV